jgi:tetratricopeptide (TPR) repeat protein
MAIAAGCGNSETPAASPRYAFLGFENLSGDPALNWTGKGSAEFLSRSLLHAMDGSVLSPDSISRTGQTLGARSSLAPGASTNRAAAIGAGANRLVTGYVEHTARGVRVTASEEDVATHRTLRTVSATTGAPFEALNRVAHQFSAKAEDPGTTNAQAFRLYCTALERPVKEAPVLLEQAVRLDPGFGRAWIALVRSAIAQGDRVRAADLAHRAHQQRLDPSDLAWIDFETTAAGGDRTASLDAMRKVSELDPDDSGLARSLAAAETTAGNFREAADVWKRITANSPGDADAWNQLGYTLCWSGNYREALGAIHEYGRLRPDEPNPLDSEGDIHYWFGKYAEAAESYTAAGAKSPAFLGGGEFYKTAQARFRAGDKAGADASFAKFKEVRGRAKDPMVALFESDWLYRTGRPQEARAAAEEALKAQSQTSVRVGLAAQMALWDLLEGNRAAATKDVAAGGNSGITPASLILRFAALPSASAAEWTARAAKDLGAPQLAGIRTTALGYALILDGKREAAIPVWEEIVSHAPGTDFFARIILAKLKKQRSAATMIPDPVNLNQFAALADWL